MNDLCCSHKQTRELLAQQADVLQQAASPDLVSIQDPVPSLWHRHPSDFASQILSQHDASCLTPTIFT